MRKAKEIKFETYNKIRYIFTFTIGDPNSLQVKD